jgi:RNA polymerase sigma-70 factor (sigma-E family)
VFVDPTNRCNHVLDRRTQRYNSRPVTTFWQPHPLNRVRRPDERGGSGSWCGAGGGHLAEDLVQTALGKSFPAYERVSRDGSFEAYVRRVLFTTYAAWWRRRWNGERPTELLPETPADDPGRDGRQDLARALAALPRGQRAVVVLRYVEDLTEAQTAELLGISVGAVKSQNARALAALRASAPVWFEEES